MKYYVCDCKSCGNPKYTKTKNLSKTIRNNMINSDCYSCSKLGSKNPAFDVPKSDKWIQKIKESNTGKIPWNKEKKLTDEHKRNISKGMLQTNKPGADPYNISLGKLGLAIDISKEEYDKLLTEKKKYYLEVKKLTEKQPLHLLENYEKRGKAKKGTDNYQLDHIIPIIVGYRNNIPAEEIAHISNLRMIPWEENIKRNKEMKILKQL